MKSVVGQGDDGDDVAEAALLAAVGAGDPAQATVMAASAVAQSGMDQYRYNRNYIASLTSRNFDMVCMTH